MELWIDSGGIIFLCISKGVTDPLNFLFFNLLGDCIGANESDFLFLFPLFILFLLFYVENVENVERYSN